MIFLFYSFLSEDEKVDFVNLYHRYRKLVYYIAYNISKNKFDAEDATSETFYKLAKHYRKINKIKKEERIYYICTVAKNTALSMYNQISKRKIEVEYENNENLFLQTHDDCEMLIQKIDYSEMLLSLNELPEKQKLIFLYKYYFEFSTKEIAKIMNIKENTISVSLHRTKKKLLYYIKKENPKIENTQR